MKNRKTLLCLIIMLALLLTGCGAENNTQKAGAWADMQPTGHMDLQYATQFQVDYYDGGYALITIQDSDRLLLVPEQADVPEGLDADITVLQQPIQNIYVAASSAMDLFSGLDALDQVRMTSTKPSDWSLPEVRSLPAVMPEAPAAIPAALNGCFRDRSPRSRPHKITGMTKDITTKGDTI